LPQPWLANVVERTLAGHSPRHGHQALDMQNRFDEPFSGTGAILSNANRLNGFLFSAVEFGLISLFVGAFGACASLITDR
jgi:hypothetical protein